MNAPILLLAILQSLALLLLHKAVVHDMWPSTDTRLLYALYTVTLALPAFLYLAVSDWRDRANAIAVAVLGILLFWLGWHAGWLASAYDDGYSSANIAGRLIFVVALLTFILAFNFRTWREHKQLRYAALLDHSWSNALIIGFLGLFLGVFWLLLTLWAALFGALGIDYFTYLFKLPEFAYPVSGIIGGWGLTMIRSRVRLLVTVRSLCEALTRALLPLVAGILLLFLLTLPFTGVTPLWDTGYATTVMLWLTVVSLFFFNAMVGDEDYTARPALRWIAIIALLALPVNVVLAAWALGLRIEQHGLSVARLHGVFVLLFASAFAFGYASIIVRHRALAMGAIRRWNTVLALALAAALCLISLPVLDFYKLTTNSQVERVLSGRVAVTAFDARYFKFQLGKYGHEALENLRNSEFADARPELTSIIDEALEAEHYWSPRKVQHDDATILRRHVTPLPDTELDDDFLTLAGADSDAQSCFSQASDQCVVGDFTHGGARYRLLIPSMVYRTAIAWRYEEGNWARIGTVRRFDCAEMPHGTTAQRLRVSDEVFFIVSDGNCRLQILPDGLRAGISFE